METSHTKVSLAVGTWLGLIALTMIISGSMLLIHLKGQKPHPVQPQRGSIGNIESMSSEEVKEAYGDVNQSALKEVKNGIFKNIANRRRAACAPQQQPVCYSPARSSCGNQYYSQPVSTPSYVAPSQQTPQYSPPNPLKIQPSCEGEECTKPRVDAPSPSDLEKITFVPGNPWNLKPSI